MGRKPISQSEYPRYPLPWRDFLGLPAALVLHKPRSFRQDARRCLQRAGVPLRVSGAENIPRGGPALLLVNHYSRPGFRAWWIALAISALVPMEVHWTMTAAWTTDGRLRSKLLALISERSFPRLARVYGFTAMPPMPPRQGEMEARARAVLQILAVARRNPPPILALAPEGQDTPGGVLMRPPPGAGRLILLLSHLGYALHPVGAFEEGGAFCLSFGSPFRLDLRTTLSSKEADRRASEIVMRAIARQLPPRLQGEFRPAQDVEALSA